VCVCVQFLSFNKCVNLPLFEAVLECVWWGGKLGAEGKVMGWLRLVGSLKLQVSFAKEPNKKDDILKKRPIILRSLLIVANPYSLRATHVCV